MATKLNNEHLDTIMMDSKSYHILDTYIALSHISSEVNGKYLIQTYTDTRADIVNQVKKYVKSSYKTIYNNVDELIRLGILWFNTELSSWSLVGMENMTKSKSSAESIEDMSNLKGYTKIRKFFLLPEFHKMKAREKRCIVYLAQLSDSKASKSYDQFVMNLSKPNSKWMKVLKTKCKYHAKYTIKSMLAAYENLFTDNSKEIRDQEYAPNSISNFKFSFKCSAIQKVDTDDSQYETIALLHHKELDLVKSRAKFSNVTLSKVQMMHIVRAVCTIKEWFLQERVVQIIINKYTAIQIHRSREGINSLPAYLVAVVKRVINEFNEFKDSISALRGNAIGLAYIHNKDTVTDSEQSDMNADIKSILKTI
ncbi:MAG: hypothetical protein ACRDA5_16530 [Clostridium sp.]